MGTSSADRRRFLNGTLYVLRIGCPSRDMHERFGKWNSVTFGSVVGPDSAFGTHYPKPCLGSV